ncbi:hypothetical protein IU438_25870 [Nocardia cyriacigeorgica]|uniref:hypothetical protein n=1 Tax=Nocardia cyriacigeorgica TaxID=135487 RepID=UPI00189320FC|nr:hypothetical protein [Nocardia cyriacigeorgica]MBF6399211.1 hypothetical protein [Nocardia cyriacigeorgica]MBF6404842.1 hypothetical protein [Nocardia cyriacigeorgica]
MAAAAACGALSGTGSAGAACAAGSLGAGAGGSDETGSDAVDSGVAAAAVQVFAARGDAGSVAERAAPALSQFVNNRRAVDTAIPAASASAAVVLAGLSPSAAHNARTLSLRSTGTTPMPAWGSGAGTAVTGADAADAVGAVVFFFLDMTGPSMNRVRMNSGDVPTGTETTPIGVIPLGAVPFPGSMDARYGVRCQAERENKPRPRNSLLVSGNANSTRGIQLAG